MKGLGGGEGGGEGREEVGVQMRFEGAPNAGLNENVTAIDETRTRGMGRGYAVMIESRMVLT